MVTNTKHFSISTDPMIQCPCCKQGRLSIPTLIVLEDVREHFRQPVTILSGARCEQHNIDVDGSEYSQHIFDPLTYIANAADITVRDTDPRDVHRFLANVPYANLLGVGRYKTFTHVDPRGFRARWYNA